LLFTLKKKLQKEIKSGHDKLTASFWTICSAPVNSSPSKVSLEWGCCQQNKKGAFLANKVEKSKKNSNDAQHCTKMQQILT
jgi:hypothetical protein